MGTDIHGGLVHRTWDDKLELIEFPPALDCRSYTFFAILADVRNGYGFAGVDTHAPIEPITSNRGLPANLPDNLDDYAFGDHSQGYVTYQELIDTELHLQETTMVGWFSEEEYLASLEPNSNVSYCRDIHSNTVTKVTEQEYKDKTYSLPEGNQLYIYKRWQATPFKDSIDLLKTWIGLYYASYNNKDLMIVFGFDS